MAESTHSDNSASPPSRPPLSGLRVIDTATLYAAPFIATLLADHGAEVIRIEPPGGDEYRHYTGNLWSLLARNKRSLVLDLNTDEGCDRLRRMIPDTDVIVVNMPKAGLKKRGLDFESLVAINPGLIMAHFSGFGLEGPYASRPGNGTTAEAFSGFTHMTGEADGPPVLPSVQLGDGVAGFAGAFGVLAACYDRLANHGPGRLIDIDAVRPMLQIMGPVLAAYDAQGDPPHRLGSRFDNPSLRNVFRTADDKWIVFALSMQRQLADAASLVGHQGPYGGENDSLLLERSVRAWVATRNRDDAMEELLQIRLMVTPANDLRDVLDDPHVRATGAVLRVNMPGRGTAFNAAPTPRFCGVKPSAEARTPELDDYRGVQSGHTE